MIVASFITYVGQEESIISPFNALVLSIVIIVAFLIISIFLFMDKNPIEMKFYALTMGSGKDKKLKFVFKFKNNTKEDIMIDFYRIATFDESGKMLVQTRPEVDFYGGYGSLRFPIKHGNGWQEYKRFEYKIPTTYGIIKKGTYQIKGNVKFEFDGKENTLTKPIQWEQDIDLDKHFEVKRPDGLEYEFKEVKNNENAPYLYGNLNVSSTLETLPKIEDNYRSEQKGERSEGSAEERKGGNESGDQ